MDKFINIFVLLFGYFISWITLINSIEVDILNTRGMYELNWAAYASSGTQRGWRESSTIAEGNRVNSVCNIAGTAVNSWLRTPYIPRGDANRIYIDIEFTMRKCDLFPNPESLQQCKESFKLLSFEAESDFANEMRPTWDTVTYEHIDVIAADETFSESTNAVINKEVRDIAVTKNGVYFAFLDQGACVTLMYIRVYYIVCPEIIQAFAYFPNTTTSIVQSEVVQTEGLCVDHAVIETAPTYFCGSNGNWQFMTGGCRCMPGYQPASPNNDRNCTACPPGKYKWRTGSESCRECPLHSEATRSASVECQCVQGFFRNIEDDKSMPCTRPPSAVTDLQVLHKDQTMVNLSWTQPADLGGRRDLFYRIEVYGGLDEPMPIFRPRQAGFNTSSVEISGLSPDTSYRIVIFAENGVSSQANSQSSVSIYVSTEPALPSKVRNLAIISIRSASIVLSWSPPSENVGNIEKYQVAYFIKAIERNTSYMETVKNNITVSGLKEDMEYSFMVRAKTTKGWGEFSDPATAKTQLENSDDNKAVAIEPSKTSPVGIIVGSAIAVIVCMLIVIVMVVIFLRRNNGQCNEKGITECDTLAYGNVHCQHLVEGSPALTGHLTMPLFTQPGGFKTYIDPHTYEDPNQAVREFTKEIDASFITIESVIGGGEFGDVCKGRLRITTRGDITVAIKTLKQGASDKNRLDFLTEASIMGQFDDPNVIFLEGVVTKSSPNMIVMEYMEDGALDAYLRANDGKYSVLQLVGIMRGIASGMRYLAEMGYIHRDLAARNILVNDNLVCKVADFGLSREIESDDTSGAYTTKGGKIPVRWTAPEAIAYRKFTSAADVWSYGVVMWEVMSYGERPYWNWSNQDVIKAVDKGFRLPPPMDCPEPIYMLMLDCWQKDRSQRPKFNPIVKTLDKLIRSPEMLRNIAKQRPHEFINPNKPDLTNYNSVEDWLTSIKMEKYVDTFLQAGCNTMDIVAQLNHQDLTRLGVTLVGHQKKIMNSVQTLRAHMMPLDHTQQISDTFIV